MTPGPRELTSAEREYLEGTRRGCGTRVLVLSAVLAFFWIMPVRAALRRGPLPSGERWGFVASTGALAVVLGGLYYLAAVRRPVWRLRDGRYARVGRVSGRYRLRGKNDTQYVGDHKVQGAERFGLVKGQDVEVEVCPAVEDYQGWLARVVLGVAGGPAGRDGGR